MDVKNAVEPRREQGRGLLAVDGPVLMLNLLKFKEKASYPYGRDAEISGREAYGRYAKEMRKMVEASAARDWRVSSI